MAIRTILEDPHPTLHAVCTGVSHFGDSLAALCTDLVDTLDASGAIGLSAPQIGESLRVLAVHVPDDGRGLRLYLNPEIVGKRGFAIIEESCLSIPGVEGRVMRSAQLQVRHQDREGTWQETEIDGLHAVCVQHEIDHLDGILFTERLSWWKRRRLRRAA
jgi:peptide deformylase